MSSLKTSVIIGHMTQQEAGLHNLRISAHFTPYSEKENQVLTLVLVGWKGSLTLTKDISVTCLAMVPAVPGETSTSDLTQAMHLSHP